MAGFYQDLSAAIYHVNLPGVTAPVDETRIVYEFAAQLDADFSSLRASVNAIASDAHGTENVRVATSSAHTLATDFEAGDTIGGVVLAAGDRIIIKDQADPIENGFYVVQASGPPVRAADADTGAEIKGLYAYVNEGALKGQAWRCSNAVAPVIDTDPISFVLHYTIDVTASEALADLREPAGEILAGGKTLFAAANGERIMYARPDLKVEFSPGPNLLRTIAAYIGDSDESATAPDTLRLIVGEQYTRAYYAFGQSWEQGNNNPYIIGTPYPYQLVMMNNSAGFNGGSGTSDITGNIATATGFVPAEDLGAQGSAMGFGIGTVEAAARSGMHSPRTVISTYAKGGATWADLQTIPYANLIAAFKRTQDLSLSLYDVPIQAITSFWHGAADRLMTQEQYLTGVLWDYRDKLIADLAAHTNPIGPPLICGVPTCGDNDDANWPPTLAFTQASQEDDTGCFIVTTPTYWLELEDGDTIHVKAQSNFQVGVLNSIAARVTLSGLDRWRCPTPRDWSWSGTSGWIDFDAMDDLRVVAPYAGRAHPTAGIEIKDATNAPTLSLTKVSGRRIELSTDIAPTGPWRLAYAYRNDPAISAPPVNRYLAYGEICDRWSYVEPRTSAVLRRYALSFLIEPLTPPSL